MVGSAARSFGANAWLVDDMYEAFLADPTSVSQSWREFFADYRPPAAGLPSSPGASGQGGRGTTGQDSSKGVKPLRGAAARVATNMEASLAVPTATSVRAVPAKLVEVNRAMLNDHQARVAGRKVSYTHLIGWAAVQAVRAVPAMNRSFAPGPSVVQPEHVGLGLAVDHVRPDGSRTLVVPCLRDADTLDFKGFVGAYEELVRKVRSNRLSPDDFAGTTVTLTNPGTLGTASSVPRVMAGQGLIVGVGAIGYPAEYEAADRGWLAEMGVSQVVTITSTYDHRVIQGAESGEFLGRVHDLLLGADGFYHEIFGAMEVPYEPVRWLADINPAPAHERSRSIKQIHVGKLVNMYRVRGHLIADLDPLASLPPRMHPELDPATYGLTLWDLDRRFLGDGLGGHEEATLGDMLGILRDAYCATVGIEYMHISEPDQKRWIQEHVEGVATAASPEEKRHILGRLNAAEAFERFLQAKYVGQTRFGLEGAESAIPLLDTVLDAAAAGGMAEVVVGMAHRGRLNVLANIVGKSYGEIFNEFEGHIDPHSVQGSGDVKYHRGAAGKFVGPSGVGVAVTLASNPSHLEAVDPVVEGMVRARQDLLGRDAVLAVLVHGDAAFSGQGVVAETLNLSGLRGYRTGGTIHLVIDNQLGFTTLPEEGRTSAYSTDVAKMVQAPIFHVNGDDPEACVRVARLAYGYRQAFHRDVVIDMVCYRRFGHNEADEPSFTQPQMYARIERHRSVRKLYTERLVSRGDITLEEAERALEDFSARLGEALEATRSSAAPDPTSVPARVVGLPIPSPATGVALGVLRQVASAIHSVPGGFMLHPKLERLVGARAEMFAGGEVDWALAEALGLGSLLLEGTDVRLAGQDTRRGTFSQRHACYVDYRTGVEHVPLGALAPPGGGSVGGGSVGGGSVAGGSVAGGSVGRFRIYDSALSEFAALGFEYGYSVMRPDALVAWEAQFGDFANEAQVVIDEFLASAGDKWDQACGLVLLLPHGYEGQGPDHSSARMERFLALAAGDNLRVVNPTTAAQHFHVLRAQVHRLDGPVPLVVFTPKSLLRSRSARSTVGELVEGRFCEVLGDPAPVRAASGAGRVVLCSGKVAYEAMARRDELGAPVAVVRVEQLQPWPEEQLAAVLARYDGAAEVVWLQEEPENMGAWGFVEGRLRALVRSMPGCGLAHVARAASGSPATGSTGVHRLEAEDLMYRAFAPLER
ncbi:MAG: multifunctional oxoglutarate decarboxylase/oxoglutarate dehydrogenase thiamine pyrophosphate-binding subunit/dihydrolipoyllysine-residue succinyltransferase subunit [Acidimicrobiales bacterium]